VVRQRLVEGQGVDIVGSTPDEFGAFFSRQMDQWARVIRERNIRAD